jgi:hypothetical protein
MLTGQIHARPESTAPGPRPARTAAEVSAWEQIEAGRYMPRRIRGSFPGRELG